RELAVLRELITWRNTVAAALDRSTFRVMGNEAMFEITRRQPRDKGDLASIKGMPRGILERNAGEILAAVERGMAVPESELPRFPRAPRWDRDPDFDARATRLKDVRDRAAARLQLDPGVLCARDRMEAVARRKPASLDELLEIPELRRWQAEVLGPDFIGALRD
ncbi:MAG TPA: HRDC domain-containing protein, partial [Candidatus Elarobacter sp.]|nr:HRDC domain-containing protein [Candidatus Elarobacter sp.]